MVPAALVSPSQYLAKEEKDRRKFKKIRGNSFIVDVADWSLFGSFPRLVYIFPFIFTHPHSVIFVGYSNRNPPRWSQKQMLMPNLFVLFLSDYLFCFEMVFVIAASINRVQSRQKWQECQSCYMTFVPHYTIPSDVSSQLDRNPLDFPELCFRKIVSSFIQTKFLFFFRSHHFPSLNPK